MPYNSETGLITRFGKFVDLYLAGTTALRSAFDAHFDDMAASVNAALLALDDEEDTGLTKLDNVAAVFASTTIYPVGTILIAREEGFRYRSVAPGSGILTPGGNTLLAQQDASGNDARALRLVASGAATGAVLNAAIAETQRGRVGRLLLPSGTIYADVDVDMHPNTASGEVARFFAIRGQGAALWTELDVVPANIDGAMGTVLVLAPYNPVGPVPGRKIVFADARSMLLEAMSIIGSVQDGPLVDAQEAFTYGGGLTNVTIVNDLAAAPIGSPVALSVSALYQSDSRGVRLIGRRDFRNAWNDDSAASANLYHGTGLGITRENQGAGGGFDKLNVHGFQYGIDCGLSASEWTADPDKFKIDRLTLQSDTQVSYCDVAVRQRAGLYELDIMDMHFENCTETFALACSGAGEMNVIGGRSSSGARTHLSTQQRAKYGHFTFGNAVESENAWKQALFQSHTFSVINQAGIFAFAGAGAGDIIIDDCIMEINGGKAVLVEMTNSGAPNIWIRNLRAPNDPNRSGPTASQLVSIGTLNATPYLAHTIVTADARYLARIEGCGDLDEDIQLPGSAFTLNRKWPPKKCHVITTGADYVVTIDDAPTIGMETAIEKRNTNNALKISIPDGMSIFDGANTKHTASGSPLVVTAFGAATQGIITMWRADDGLWKTSAALT